MASANAGSLTKLAMPIRIVEYQYHLMFVNVNLSGEFMNSVQDVSRHMSGECGYSTVLSCNSQLYHDYDHVVW